MCNLGAHAPLASGRTAGVEEAPSRACRYYKGSSLAGIVVAVHGEWPPGISRTVLFIIAVIAAALGFRGIAGMSADIGWVFAMLAR